MRILGIDPGLNATGYGVIEILRDECVHIHHGVVRTKTTWTKAERLTAIRDGVRDAARLWGATSGAIEASFIGTNARSSMALGEARAAAIIGMADAGLEVMEYAPTLVKQTVAGYGRGEKSQVAENGASPARAQGGADSGSRWGRAGHCGDALSAHPAGGGRLTRCLPRVEFEHHLCCKRREHQYTGEDGDCEPQRREKQTSCDHHGQAHEYQQRAHVGDRGGKPAEDEERAEPQEQPCCEAAVGGCHSESVRLARVSRSKQGG